MAQAILNFILHDREHFIVKASARQHYGASEVNAILLLSGRFCNNARECACNVKFSMVLAIL